MSEQGLATGFKNLQKLESTCSVNMNLQLYAMTFNRMRFVLGIERKNI